MSLCRIFNIEERFAEEEWLSKFTIFSDYAIFEMFVTIQGLFLRISDVLLMVVHSCSAVSVLHTYCFEHTGHVIKYGMNLLLQWNLLFSLIKVAPVGDLASVSLFFKVKTRTLWH